MILKLHPVTPLFTSKCSVDICADKIYNPYNPYNPYIYIYTLVIRWYDQICSAKTGPKIWRTLIFWRLSGPYKGFGFYTYPHGRAWKSRIQTATHPLVWANDMIWAYYDAEKSPIDLLHTRRIPRFLGATRPKRVQSAPCKRRNRTWSNLVQASRPFSPRLKLHLVVGVSQKNMAQLSIIFLWNFRNYNYNS